MKLNDLFLETRAKLRNAGLPASELEAEWIIGHAFGMSAIERIQRPERIVTPLESEKVKNILSRRMKGEPLAYILGEKDFFGFKFTVTPNVLIPRPETEHLVERALEWAQDNFLKDEPVELLDLGTGSGCIVVTLLLLIPELKAVAVDISDDALEVARENSVKHGVRERLELVKGDAGDVSALLNERKFDCVLANPPYVESSDASVAESVRKYEPSIALFSSGLKGLEISSMWIAELPKLLKRQRSAAGVEFGYNQAREIEEFFRRTGIFAKHEIVRDYSGHERLIWGMT